VNFVGTIADAYTSTKLIDRLFAALGRYTVAAHVKDLRIDEALVVHISECALGEGLLDLESFLRHFDATCPEGFALIEHLPEAAIPGAKRALDAAMLRAGLAWRE
jgi:sugar phosphate isomerase/epimerase